MDALVSSQECLAIPFPSTVSADRVRIERIVKLREERQARLTDETSPLRFVAVIEESALDRMVGGPEVMRGQLRHLLVSSKRDDIALHLSPRSVAIRDGLDGEFALLSRQRLACRLNDRFEGNLSSAARRAPSVT
ncbi:Scr1 family TA system antitoxin-like transcriptional regulator [Lentzea sp. NPDC051208]|uniref:Scr1 family TA system antitoxin-like transcriptional regulator n=1 Tax=Lentzea sp. NPDC051208 TaxID=3154642 RepID=UPI00342A2FE7